MLPAALIAAPPRRRLLFLLLLLGLTLRAYHYLRDRAVWQDEAGLLLTAASRDYHDLFLGQLDYHQAAPPLYLCLLKTVGLLLGDNSRALRLPSFLASCAALLLFLTAARRMLNPQALPWAVLLFAVSEQLLWHASEAKAYSVDVLAAVVVLSVPCWAASSANFVGRICNPSSEEDGLQIRPTKFARHKSWNRLDSLRRQLLAYTFLAPLLLLSSYPACFLFAGLLLAYLPAVRSRKQGTTWLTYGALAAMTAATLVWLVLGPARCQHDAAIHSCWVAHMPNWERPWTVPGWLLLAPFEIGRYCCKPSGQILVLFAVPGTLLLWRAGERTMVRLMLAPILLALAAACLHVYPFGGARVMAYAVPAILLLAAEGVPSVLAWLRVRSRLACAGLIGLLLAPAAVSLAHVFHPWSEADIPSAAAYVQSQRREDDLIIGNDVAQRYYFRHFGSAFHLLDESPFPAPAGDRLWVVMTAALPRPERERLASHFVPSGWRPRQQREFAFTTVLLFTR